MQIGDFASTSAGDPFAFFPSVIPGQGAVLLGDGFVSGSSIATTMTFAGSSLASIGITPGTYTWTFGAGADSDFITIQVASVPEPACIAMASLGLVLAARGFRRAYCLQNHECPRD